MNKYYLTFPDGHGSYIHVLQNTDLVKEGGYTDDDVTTGREDSSFIEQALEEGYTIIPIECELLSPVPTHGCCTYHVQVKPKIKYLIWFYDESWTGEDMGIIQDSPDIKDEYDDEELLKLNDLSNYLDDYLAKGYTIQKTQIVANKDRVIYKTTGVAKGKED